MVKKSDRNCNAANSEIMEGEDAEDGENEDDASSQQSDEEDEKWRAGDANGFTESY